MRLSRIALYTSLSLLVVSTTAYADGISGVAYRVPATTAENVPTKGNVPGSGATEIAVINASAIQFSYDQGTGSYTLGGFLNALGAANSITYMNGASASTDPTNTLFEFTGSAYFVTGQTFNVYHDDGVNMYVDGNAVLLAPASTSPITTPYTYDGPTGTYAFDFIYANSYCCQAEFETNLVTASTVTGVTPEPSSFMLLGTGLLGTAGVVRRRFAS